MIKKFGWVVCLLLGCGSTEMTATGEPQAPRAMNCAFDILTSTPSAGYKEIGTVDVNPGGYGIDVFTDLGEFKQHIRPNVCELGGDAAIAYANGYGMYIKATVLKRVAGGEPAAASVANAGPAASPKKHGCEFDAQCKGDRICVDGRCQSPVASSAPAPGTEPVAASPSPAAPATSAKAPAPASH